MNNRNSGCFIGHMALARRVGLTLVLLSGIPLLAQQTAFINGKWFNGKALESRTWYAVNGGLHPNKPWGDVQTVDLQGMYVVPACGEAHNHAAASDRPVELARFLSQGILYAKNPANIKEAREGNGVNTPGGIDVIFSNGVITAPEGHPLVLVKRGGIKVENSEGDFYHTVSSVAELDQKFPNLLAQKPDFIKLILVYSEEFEKRNNDAKYFSRRGLDPSLVKPIVERAHAAGLPVSAHVESAADFHVAVEAGVNEINHTPGFWPTAESIAAPDFSIYKLAEADVRKAAKQHMDVVTTLGEGLQNTKKMQSAARDAYIATVRANIELLRKHKVRILMGSDQYRASSQAEVLALAEFHIMPKLDLLRSWCEDTPRAIFRKRRIGKIKDGYEANFVVVGADPLADLTAMKDVRMVYKRGARLATTAK